MVSRVALGFVRLARVGSLMLGALAVALAVAAADPPPPATGVVLPTVQVPVIGTPASAPTPPAAPTLSIAEQSARRAVCDRWIAVIAGRLHDAALLAHPDVQALAMQEPDVATCGAIAADTKAPCAVFVGSTEEIRGNRKDCIGAWSIFHELRAFPKGRGYMFDEAQVDDCKGFAPMAPLCEPFRDALRSGEPAECAKAGALAPVCRAYLAADPSLCRVESPDLAGLDEDCRKQIERKALYRTGLKGLAASGTARERAFAQAAMGQRKACAAFDEAAKARCVAAGQPPAPTPAVPPTPGPTTPTEMLETPAAGTPAANAGVG